MTQALSSPARASKGAMIAQSIRSARKKALKDYLDMRKIATRSRSNCDAVRKALFRMKSLRQIIIQYDLFLAWADIESEAS